MSDNRHLTPEISGIDNVRISLHDVGDLRSRYHEWDGLSKQEQLSLARQVEPTRVVESSNITTTGLHELIVDQLHGDQAVDESASHLALGTDSTQPDSGNSALNNEVYRVTVTDTADRGSELFTSTFLDSTEANGNTLVEAGLVTSAAGGSNVLLNHALISDIVKDDESTATIDVSLSFSNP
jgi:hypothetical protein